MFPEQNEFNLANLPADIIRKIIGLQLESIESTRLISPRWNALVSEHLQHRKRLPAIDSFSWRIDSCGNHYLNMRLPFKFQDYFGIKWRWIRLVNLHHSTIDIDSGAIIDENGVLLDRITRLLRRCSRVEKLELDMDVTKHSGELEVIKNTIFGVGQLTVKGITYFNNESASHVIDVIRAFPLRRLLLVNVECHRPYMRSGEFFNSALSAVRFLELSLFDENDDVAYAYDVVFWNSVAKELTSRLAVTAEFRTKWVNGRRETSFVVDNNKLTL